MQCAKCKAAALKSNELNIKREAQKCKKRSREWEREIIQARIQARVKNAGQKRERERKKKGRGRRKKKD